MFPVPWTTMDPNIVTALLQPSFKLIHQLPLSILQLQGAQFLPNFCTASLVASGPSNRKNVEKNMSWNGMIIAMFDYQRVMCRKKHVPRSRPCFLALRVVISHDSWGQETNYKPWWWDDNNPYVIPWIDHGTYNDITTTYTSYVYCKIPLHEPLRVGWWQGYKHHQKIGSEALMILTSDDIRYLTPMNQCQSKAK